MKILKISVKLLLLLIAIVIAVPFFLPSSTSVSRAMEINVPPEKLFAYVNNFEQFNRWSPWYGIDPDAKYEFEGPAEGVGSLMRWSSEHQSVGVGSQKIVRSEPNKGVVTELSFEGQGNATARFDLEAMDGATRLTWSFETDWGNNLVGRYMGLMMDKWVGNEYEKGLQNLKQLAENE